MSIEELGVSSHTHGMKAQAGGPQQFRRIKFSPLGAADALVLLLHQRMEI